MIIFFFTFTFSSFFPIIPFHLLLFLSLFLLFSTKRADLRNSTAMAFLSMLHNADSHTPELHRTDWGVYHLRRVVDDVEEEPHLVSLFHVFGFFILVSPPLVVMLAKLDLFINLYKKKKIDIASSSCKFIYVSSSKKEEARGKGDVAKEEKKKEQK